MVSSVLPNLCVRCAAPRFWKPCWVISHPPPARRHPEPPRCPPTSLRSAQPIGEERDKFFAALESGPSYEPQLRYADPGRAERVRATCDKHLSTEFEAMSKAVLEGIIADHQSEERYQESVWGPTIDAQEAVEKMCGEYVSANALAGKVDFVCGHPRRW